LQQQCRPKKLSGSVEKLANQYQLPEAKIRLEKLLDLRNKIDNCDGQVDENNVCAQQAATTILTPANNAALTSSTVTITYQSTGSPNHVHGGLDNNIATEVRDTDNDGTMQLMNALNGQHTLYVYPANADHSRAGPDATITVTVNAQQTSKVGDIDNDNDVDIIDFLAMAKAFGTSAGEALFDIRADLNKDNGVDILDLLLAAANFGI